MKVLWITNQPIGGAVGKLGFKAATGTWMEAAFLSAAADEEMQLSVACKAPIDTYQTFFVNGIEYFCVPQGNSVMYPYKSKKNRRIWREIIGKAAPDVIMIWGTEYAHGLCAMLEAEGVPTVIVIQGILSSVERYYLGGMTPKELRQAYTLRSFLKRDSIRRQQKKCAKRAEYEKEMLRRAGNVVIESKWAEAIMRAIEPNCKTFYYRLEQNKVFFEREWKLSTKKPFSVFCTAPVGYPLKGLHNLVKAMNIVCQRYPEAVLRVPGWDDPFKETFIQRMRKNDYRKYIVQLIKEYGLQKNIQFLGRLTSEQMAEELFKCNVYVMSSCIENHSISLREAMSMGTPCISSFVGGVPELLKDGENGLLYRFEEYEQLAQLMMCVMENNDLAERLGKNARETMVQYSAEENSSEVLRDICVSLFKNSHRE